MATHQFSKIIFVVVKRHSMVTTKPQKAVVNSESKKVPMANYEGITQFSGSNVCYNGNAKSATVTIRQLNPIDPKTLNAYNDCEIGFLKSFRSSGSFNKNSVEISNVDDNVFGIAIIEPIGSESCSPISSINYYSNAEIATQIFNAVFACPRTYILFFNSAFIEMFAQYIVDIDTFAIKIDDKKRRGSYHIFSFTRLNIHYKGLDCIVGVTDSIYDTSMDPETAEEYGYKALEIIKRGFFLKQPLWNFKNIH